MAARSCDPDAVVPDFRWIPQPRPAYVSDWIFEADSDHRLALVKDFLVDSFVNSTPVWLFAPMDSRERIESMARMFPEGQFRWASIGPNGDEVLRRVGMVPTAKPVRFSVWPEEARFNFTAALLDVAERNLVESSVLRGSGRAQLVGNRFREGRLYVDWDLDPDQTMAATRPGGEMYAAIASP